MFVPMLPSHVTIRGNDRQDIFRCDGDRLRFLDCLGKAALHHGLLIHAYVLMTNHVHLLVTGKDSVSAPKTIQSLGRQYVAYFNERYGRTGTLWEGRYRSTLVEADRYLLACHRYIDMNPVRVGLVEHPAEYLWSSHRFYALGSADDLVTPHSTFLALGISERSRREAYSSLFDQPLNSDVLERIRHCSRNGWALGSQDFCRLIESATNRRTLPLEPGWKRGRKRGPRPRSQISESDPHI